MMSSSCHDHQRYHHEQQFVQEYRGAIALNNVGVTLLERGCYKQAMDTLQDAIHVMKEVFRPNAPAPLFQQQQQQKVDVNSPLQNAHRRLADPQQTPFPSAAAAQALHLEAINFDMGLTPVLNYLHETPSTTSFLPVRIDLPVDFSSPAACTFSPASSMNNNRRDPDLESSIILYNFGVANLLISKVAATSPSSCDKLRSNALSILQLASGVLSKRSGTCDDGVEEANLLQMGLLVFHATIQVLVEGGDDFEASVVCERYDRIRNAVVALQDAEWYGNMSKVSAPAA